MSSTPNRQRKEGPSLAGTVGHAADERVSERACRRIIARYRTRLDWMLHVPAWENAFPQGLEALSLPMPRRGINLRSVVDALPLESKWRLLVWTLDQYRKRMDTPTALKLCEWFALDLWRSTELDAALKHEQWAALKEKLKFSLNREHQRYKRAQQILFRRYQSLLHKMVNRQVFDPGKRADAQQEASLGLIHAIDKVEDSKSSFGSYARTWISRSIRNYLMHQHFPVHVPINLASRLLRHASQSQDDGDPVRDANAGGDDEGGLNAYTSLLQPGLSLDESVGEGHYAQPQFQDDQAVIPSETLSRKDAFAAIQNLMGKLTDKQRRVIELRFGLDSGQEVRTLASVANTVGISHQQVSMREKRALEKLEQILKPIYDEL